MARDDRAGVRVVLERAAKARVCPAAFFDFAAREDGGERRRCRAGAAQRAALLFAAQHPQAVVRLPPGAGRTALVAWLALWLAGEDPEGSGVVAAPSREAAEGAARQGWEALGGEGARPRSELLAAFPGLCRGAVGDPWGAGAWTVARGPGPSTREPTCRAAGQGADLARARPLSWVLCDALGEGGGRDGHLDARRWFANHVAARADVVGGRCRVLVVAGEAEQEDLAGALERAGWPCLSVRADGVVSVSNAPEFEAPGVVEAEGGGLVLRHEPGGWRGRGGAVPAALVPAAPEVSEGPRGPSLADFAERYRDDYLGFVRLLEVKPREAAGVGRVPFVPTAIQGKRIRSRTPRDVVEKPRQVKVTTEELARDFWFFLTKPGVSVLVLCQSSSDERMLTELSERISVFIDALRKNAGLDLAEHFVRATRTEWALPNDSTLRLSGAGASEAAAQKKGRGGTVHRLHCTEVASWEYAGQTLNAVLESIAGPEHGTEVVFESTANGAGGDDGGSMLEASGAEYFYALCKGARAHANGYAFHFFSWLDEPEYALPLEPHEVVDPADQPDAEKRERERQLLAAGATREQVKWWRSKARGKGLDEMDQEYPHDPDLAFLVSGRQFFDRQKVEGFVVGAQEPLERRDVRRPGAVGEVRVYRRPVKGRRYELAADPSEGVGKDRGVATLRERGSGELCAVVAGQFKPEELAKECARLGYEYLTARLAAERQNHGHAVNAEWEREGPGKARYPKVFRDHDGRPGWVSSEASRSEALSQLDRAVRDEEWVTPDAETAREMRAFVVGKRGKAEARKGSRDDLVLAEAILWDLLRRVRSDDEAPVRAPPPVVRHHEQEGIG